MKTPELCDTFTTKGDRVASYGKKPSYRITCFYRIVNNPNLKREQARRKTPLLAELFEDLWKDDDADRVGKVKLVKCHRLQADYVEGSGVCGTITKIENIELKGRVNWSEERIREERINYRNRFLSDNGEYEIHPLWIKER